MENRQKRKLPLRSFGLTVGGVFVAIGVWPFWWQQQDGLHIWAVAVGIPLMLCGGIAPYLLRPLYRFWMTLGHALGRVNTQIILGVLFFGVLTPLGILARWGGRDFIRVKAAPGVETYRLLRTARPVGHVRHQF
jgi:hypothetical protein